MNISPNKLAYTYKRFNKTIESRAISCHFCGTVFDIETVHRGEQVACPNCGQILIRIEKFPAITPFIYALLALFAFFLSMYFNILKVSILNSSNQTSIVDILKTLNTYDHYFLTTVFFVFIVITPLAFIFSALYVYAAILLQKNFFELKKVAKFMVTLRPWIMVDIFFIAIIVSLVKIQALAEVHLDYGVITLFGYSIFLARIVLASSDFWIQEKIANLSHNSIVFFKQSSEQIINQSRVKMHLAWALLITAIIFYLPANLLPIMITSGLTYHYEDNLLAGVFKIWDSGDYLIGTIIFVASFLIPIVKIFVLLLILLSISFKKVPSPKFYTNLFVIIERIGRWSMIDVFVIILMVTLFHNHFIFISPGAAVVYFCLVVVITMIATSLVDTRLLWIYDVGYKTKSINFDSKKYEN